VVAIAPTWAASGSASTTFAVVSYAIPDVYLDGPGEVPLPVTTTYTKEGTSEPSQVSLSIDLTALSAAGGPAIVVDNNVTIDDSPSGTFVQEFTISGDASAARDTVYQVSGGISTTFDPGDSAPVKETAAFPDSSFTVHKSVTSVTGVRARHVTKPRASTLVTGRAVATTSKGVAVRPDGLVALQARRRGTATWSTLRAKPSISATGVLTARVRTLPAGTRLRVTITHCEWCSDARGAARVR
jgi:hypothetical protein